MRIFTISLSFLLLLAACTSAATPASDPTSVPVQSTGAAVENAPVAEPSTIPTLESSLLATEWRGRSEGNVLFPMDPASGSALPEYTPISIGQIFAHEFSPDRQMLAVVSFPTQDYHNGSLLLIDLPTWKAQAPFDLGLAGWVNAIVFSPDGRQLAIAHGQSSHQITIVDIETGVITAQRKTDSVLVSRLKFTKDGTALMFYGPQVKDRFTVNEMSAGPPQVMLLSASDLDVLWTAQASEVRDGIFPRNENTTPGNIHEPGQAYYMNPGVVFAPDQDALYVVHADSEKLTTIDFEQQIVETVDIQPELSWFEKLLSLTSGIARAKIGDGISRQAVVSKDGQILYVVGMNSVTSQDTQGNWQMEQTPLGLEIIQTRDGNRLEHYESDATELSFSPDGRFLYLRSWGEGEPWTEVFDTVSQQFGPRAEWTSAFPVLRMDGSYLLASAFSTGEYTHHMSILEPDGLKELAAWTDSTSIWWLAP